MNFKYFVAIFPQCYSLKHLQGIGLKIRTGDVSVNSLLSYLMSFLKKEFNPSLWIGLVNFSNGELSSVEIIKMILSFTKITNIALSYKKYYIKNGRNGFIDCLLLGLIGSSV